MEELSFPDLPQLDLDQLLGQLIERADDVRAAQGRLRGLLRANAAVAADLSLPVVLRRIVDAARDLIGARYAALGVIGRDGQLEQFVHAGMASDVVARIGHLPSGCGVLGLLISDPVPIRLADLAAHPASAGFPPGHPPMGAFLGVPIRAGEEVFGNLYLTERSRGGQFTAEDQELAVALAAAAGGAIANARRFSEAEQRQRWLAAAAELTPLLLSGEAAEPFTVIAQYAAAAAEADLAAVARLHAADQVIVQAASGLMAADAEGRTVPLQSSPAARAIQAGKPYLASRHHRKAACAGLSADLGPLMVVPLAAGDQALGALVLARQSGRPEFTEASLQMAAVFAGHAAVALELSRARADQIAQVKAEDHDRIASDLHDHVIRELSAVGMGLQGMAGRPKGPGDSERISGYIETLDKIISRIRASIFALQPRQREPHVLHAHLLEIAGEHASQLGFTPCVRFSGPPDEKIGSGLAHDILAVTREALSNCARHAHASRVDLALAVSERQVSLEVTDNGRGVGAPGRYSGLASMRQRAERNGGTLRLGAADGGGTKLTWTARLPP